MWKLCEFAGMQHTAAGVLCPYKRMVDDALFSEPVCWVTLNDGVDAEEYDA